MFDDAGLKNMQSNQTTPARSTSGARTELIVNGMTCSGCVRQVTEAIQEIQGVTSALVSLEEKHASVRWAADAQADPRSVIEAVAKAGYEAKVIDTAEAHHASHAHEKEGLWSANALLSIIPTAILMAGEWLFQLGDAGWYRWVSFALAAVVQFGPGRQFYRGAWNQLKAGGSNMDTLVALGSTTAFSYSAWALLSGAGGHLYFMEAAAIITLISVGHWMEARVSAQASSSLKALMTLAPARARRRQPDGTEQEVAVADLQLTDVMVLKPGDRVPTDGEVLEGASAVDESMLTGESMPVEKARGANIYAGTVNQSGQLIARVTSTGEETALAHIIAAVARAQTSRANIQRLGDRVSNMFVPIVVLIALATAAWWGLLPDAAHRVSLWLGQYLWSAHPPASALAAAVVAAAAVLIVACPCAMGLATPAAIMAGSNAAAKRGILIRDGVALEKAGEVTAVLFDKTGTLTVGKPELAASELVKTGTAITDEEILKLAASLASGSSHPLSLAASKLHPDRIAMSEWKEVRGAGLQARRSSGSIVQLGSLRWLSESGVDLAASKAFVGKWSAEGATVLGLVEEKSLLLLIALKDTVKPGATRVVQQLRHQGLSVYLVTGDNPLTAASIAKQAGIPAQNVFAEVRPEQKAEFVKRLRTDWDAMTFTKIIKCN